MKPGIIWYAYSYTPRLITDVETVQGFHPLVIDIYIHYKTVIEGKVVNRKTTKDAFFEWAERNEAAYQFLSVDKSKEADLLRKSIDK